MTNEKKVLPNGILVQRYNIIGTNWWCYEAHVPQEGLTGGCSSICHELDRWWGKIGTEPLPPEVDAIPARLNGQWNQARFDACDKFHQERYEAAYTAIVEAFPEAANGRRSMGTIDIFEGPHADR
jgi:hypothetical protein